MNGRDSGSPPAVEVAGVSCSYRRVRAVSDLDLRIEANEMFALVGPDGAGKTTTIRLLFGILRPGSGSIRILG
ncbi:MAG TPA: ATP-binding cassette domain-containing protein, partial [Spirochaetia bacterium]|nr:ATP-binding cassette domain-containing protein [Spirochaetia bacterium]